MVRLPVACVVGLLLKEFGWKVQITSYELAMNASCHLRYIYGIDAYNQSRGPVPVPFSLVSIHIPGREMSLSLRNEA